MKTIFRYSQPFRARINLTPSRQRAYWTAIWLASLACGGGAAAQTNVSPLVGISNIPEPIIVTNVTALPALTNAPASAAVTNATAPVAVTNAPAQTQITNNAPPVAITNRPASGSTTNVTKLQETTVVGKLDAARSQIMPDIGGTVTTMTSEQILSISQGDNAPFNEVILRAPGVAQDSAANGDLHVRGEHANLQYRINDVLLPEGISGFGLELDPRFVDTFKFITGSLPAQYGFRTAAVVDIQTKSGALEPGGEVEMYGGSHDTIRPSFEYGGTEGKLTYFIDGSFDHNSLGIENPTPSSDAIHDVTDQYKTFTYFSYLLDDTSRVSFIGSLS